MPKRLLLGPVTAKLCKMAIWNISGTFKLARMQGSVGVADLSATLYILPTDWAFPYAPYPPFRTAFAAVLFTKRAFCQK